ncbi:MAG: hypothetical protein Q9190_004595 [Brigantiaea leucoxantha]
MLVTYQTTCVYILSFFCTLIASAPRPQRGGVYGGNFPGETVVVTTIVENPSTPSSASFNSNGNPTSVAPSSPSSTSTSSSDGGNIGSSTGGSGPKGLAYNSSSPSLDIFDGYDSVTWAHNWNSDPASAASRFTFVPTLWSDQSPHSDNWASFASGHAELLSFNEPDNIGQANMRVDDAVTAYTNLMMPQRVNGVRIGAPSVSNGVGNNEAGIPMGMGWLNDFLGKCNEEASGGKCVADFVAVHWYGCTNGCSVDDDVTAFKDFIGQATGTGYPVWVPEFQRIGSPETQKDFLNQVAGWLDGQVEKYAYFMVLDGILTDGGQVNDLGNTYATA